MTRVAGPDAVADVVEGLVVHPRRAVEHRRDRGLDRLALELGREQHRERHAGQTRQGVGQRGGVRVALGGVRLQGAAELPQRLAQVALSVGLGRVWPQQAGQPLAEHLRVDLLPGGEPGEGDAVQRRQILARSGAPNDQAFTGETRQVGHFVEERLLGSRDEVRPRRAECSDRDVGVQHPFFGKVIVYGACRKPVCRKRTFRNSSRFNMETDQIIIGVQCGAVLRAVRGPIDTRGHIVFTGVDELDGSARFL